MGLELQRLNAGNLSAQVYASIRQALIDGRFAPGQRLRIGALAGELGTSVTPVREAIIRLVSEQALAMTAATAVYVPFLDSARMREIRLIRMELEGLAAATAATLIDDDGLTRLEAIQKRFIAAAATDPKAASACNREFHFAVLDIARMPKLEVIVESLWTLMGPLMSVFHSTMPVRHIASDDHPHYEVLAALQARDADRARRALAKDIAWGSVLEGWLDEQSDGRKMAAKQAL